MPALLLTRFASCHMGTFGFLSMSSGFECYSIEKPWRDNRPWTSCVPVGTYNLTATEYQRGGYPTFEVAGVPGRSRIVFHVANVSTDLAGCIGVGSALGCVRGRWAVLNSAATFRRFMDAMRDAERPASITIQWGEHGTDDRHARGFYA